jgi:hypothetical protein
VDGGDLGERPGAVRDEVGGRVGERAAVGGSGNNADRGALCLRVEGVEDLLEVELLAAGVRVVAAGRDGGADDGLASGGERPGAVDDRAASGECRHHW